MQNTVIEERLQNCRQTGAESTGLFFSYNEREMKQVDAAGKISRKQY